jgi:hypothetical protein
MWQTVYFEYELFKTAIPSNVSGTCNWTWNHSASFSKMLKTKSEFFMNSESVSGGPISDRTCELRDYSSFYEYGDSHNTNTNS